MQTMYTKGQARIHFSSIALKDTITLAMGLVSMVTLLVMFVLAPLCISLLTIPAFPFLAAIMRAVSWESWNQVDNILMQPSHN